MRQIRLLFTFSKKKQNKTNETNYTLQKVNCLFYPSIQLMDYINLKKKITLTKMPLISITAPKLIIISKKITLPLSQTLSYFCVLNLIHTEKTPYSDTLPTIQIQRDINFNDN